MGHDEQFLCEAKVTIEESLRGAAEGLKIADVPQPRREAELLLSLALGCDKTFLIAHPEHVPSAADLEKFRSYVDRRISREPFQYISGKQEFFGLDFAVSPDVLIPRPETELLVEAVIEELGSSDEQTRFCELGVGSGCIAISVLRHLRDAVAWGGDISADAVEVARANSIALGVDGRLQLCVSDLFAAFGGERFDLIVSNPPYVAATDLPGLQAEVRDHEPHIALTDAADGLSIISRIIDEAPTYLNPGGSLLLEIGFDQSERVSRMFDEESWSNIQTIHDLQGIPRVFRATHGGN